MKRVFIVGGSRTPFLKSDAKRGPFTGVDLALHASKSVLSKTGLSPTDIEEVVLGSVMIEPTEVNPARVLGVRLGVPVNVPAYTVQRNCTSGLDAIDNAVKDIQLGRHEVILCGGTEAMSHATLHYRPVVSDWFSRMSKKRTLKDKIRHFFRLPVAQMLNPIISLMEGLKDPFHKVLMGVTAENIADKAGITRLEMDRYSVRSHSRAHSHDFSQEIEPMFDSNGNFFEHDGGIRLDVTLEKLGRMRPAFTRNGTITAANSSQITDGAAMLIVASERYISDKGLKPIAEIIDVAWAGVEPMSMGIGPVPAINSLLVNNNLDIGAINHVEINEAFAGQVLACNAELGIDETILNPHGGSVALGHPIGASLARLALHASLNIDGYSIVSGCVGGGQAGAMLLKEVT